MIAIAVNEKLEKEILGVIKSSRYKTIKTTDRHPTGIYVTKIMTFSAEQALEWLENELHQRVDTIREIQKAGYIHIQMDYIFEAILKLSQNIKTLYLTKRYVAGITLADILHRKSQLEIITRPQNAKEIVWEMLALLLSGGGFKNIIVTNQNLIFQISGNQGYRPTLNYLSFVGLRFIKFQKDIDRDQYRQTAIFFDEEAYISKNINRFEFKARNFAILVLSLVCGIDISEFVLKGLNISSVISFQQAKTNHQQHIQPKLLKLLNYPKVQKSIQDLEIPGLLEFINTAFSLKKDTKLNWAEVQRMLLKDATTQTHSAKFQRLAKQFWQCEPEDMKKKYERQGLNYVDKSPWVYLAIKIGVRLQYLLKSNDWDKLFNDQRFSRWKAELWHRMLAIYNKIKRKNYNQLAHLKSLGDQILNEVYEIEQKKVFLITHQRKTLLMYDL